MSSTAVADKENLPLAGVKRKETKGIIPDQRVSAGSVGEKIPNPDPKQCRQHGKWVMVMYCKSLVLRDTKCNLMMV